MNFTLFLKNLFPTSNLQIFPKTFVSSLTSLNANTVKHFNSLSDEIFFFFPNVQQALSLVFILEAEQAVEELMLIEVLDEASGQVDVVLPVPRSMLALVNFRLLVVHDISQFEAEAIFAFVALLFADVFVLVINEIRQQPSDVDAEELVALLNRVAFQVQRAQILEEPQSLEL